MSRSFSANDPNPYGSDDAFDTYIDMDFLGNDAMEEEVDFGNMSSSDLFRYYLGGEIKDTDQTTYPAPMQTVNNDFSLVTSPVSTEEDLKLTPVPIMEETNEIAQQAISTTAVAVLNAQLAELLAKLPIIKQETTDKTTSPTSPKSNVTQAVVKPAINSPSNNNSNAQKSDDNQIDMKKLSSKERRQIRNKISARNFRVRRKEYIQNLETTKEQQQEEINLLRQALLHLQEENTKLQQEVEELRKLKQNTKPVVASPPSPPHISSSTSKESDNIISSLTKISNNNSGNISRPNQVKGALPTVPHQPSSYLVIPNVNKDASPSSSSANSKAWQDSRVRVQTTLIPEFNLDKHLFKEKSTFSYLDFRNSYPYSYSSMINLIEFSQSTDGQRFWLAYMLVSTLMQQMTNLFIEAVCATPRDQMISALFRNVKTSALEHANEILEVVNEEKKSEDSLEPSLEVEQLNNEMEVQKTSLLDNNTMVESVKEASVLDWLYDAMVKHVVEQSQMEAKMAELSDWVGEELDDNVLPFLF